MNEDQLREAARDALVAFREFYMQQIDNDTEYQDEYDHALVSKTQIEAAMRILWMNR